MTLSKYLLARVSAPSSVKQQGILASYHGVRVKRLRTQHQAKQEVLTHVTCFHYDFTFKGGRHSCAASRMVLKEPHLLVLTPSSALPTMSAANVWNRCEVAQVSVCGF